MLTPKRREADKARKSKECHWTLSLSQLCRANQNTDAKHDHAAENDLEDGLEKWRIHVASANVGDHPQFEEDDDARNRGCDPECVRPCVRHKVGKGVTQASERRHDA